MERYINGKLEFLKAVQRHLNTEQREVLNPAKRGLNVVS